MIATHTHTHRENTNTQVVFNNFNVDSSEWRSGITMKRNEMSYQHGRINLEIMRSAAISGCFKPICRVRMFIEAKAFKTDHDGIFISPWGFG
jgi:hypothetical protein